MKKKSFKELFEEARKSEEYWIAYAKLDFTEDLYRLMEERGMKKADLAKKIGKSSAYITKVFKGNANFTLETMVRLVRVLGGKLKIGVEKEEAKKVQKEMKWEIPLEAKRKVILLEPRIVTHTHGRIAALPADWLVSWESQTTFYTRPPARSPLIPDIPMEEEIDKNFATA